VRAVTILMEQVNASHSAVVRVSYWVTVVVVVAVGDEWIVVCMEMAVGDACSCHSSGNASVPARYRKGYNLYSLRTNYNAVVEHVVADDDDIDLVLAAEECGVADALVAVQWRLLYLSLRRWPFVAFYSSHPPPRHPHNNKQEPKW